MKKKLRPDNQTGVTTSGMHLLSKKHSKKTGLDMLKSATKNLHKKSINIFNNPYPYGEPKSYSKPQGQKVKVTNQDFGQNMMNYPAPSKENNYLQDYGFKNGYKSTSAGTKGAIHKKHKKNWIAGAIKHPGALHRELGIKAGHKIPAKTLAKVAKKPGVEGKRARLAETLKGFHHGKKHHKKISMTKQEAVKEHEHLTKVLKTGKGLKDEYKKQERELQEYKRAKTHKKVMCKKHNKAHCKMCS